MVLVLIRIFLYCSLALGFASGALADNAPQKSKKTDDYSLSTPYGELRVLKGKSGERDVFIDKPKLSILQSATRSIDQWWKLSGGIVVAIGYAVGNIVGGCEIYFISQKAKKLVADFSYAEIGSCEKIAPQISSNRNVFSLATPKQFFEMRKMLTINGDDISFVEKPAEEPSVAGVKMAGNGKDVIRWIGKHGVDLFYDPSEILRLKSIMKGDAFVSMRQQSLRVCPERSCRIT